MLVPQTDNLMTIEDFASAIGKSTRTVFRYVNRGRLKSITVMENGRSLVRIPEGELERFTAESVSHSYTMADSPLQPVSDRLSPGSLSATPVSATVTPITAVADTPASSVSHILSATPPLSATGVSVTPVEVTVTVSDVADKPVSSVTQAVSQPIVEPVDNVTAVIVEQAPENPNVETQGHITATEILHRYESAVMRLGYIEGQLAFTQRMLGDGGHREEELRQKLEEAERAKQAEAAARLQMETELAEARQRLATLEAEKQMSWWKRCFSSNR